FSDGAAKWASRIFLIVVATIIPLMLWLSGLHLAYWAIGVTACEVRWSDGCAVAWGADTWNHSPSLLERFFQSFAILTPSCGASVAYAIMGAAQLLLWLVWNVNANSLHQLYRDRLGSAFLFRRIEGDGPLEGADRFMLSQIVPKASPYHLINAA